MSEVDNTPPAARLPTPRLRDMSESELPREKLDRHGAGALNDPELLALFFGTGTKGLNVIEMSRMLLERHGSLVDLSRFGWEEFMSVPGIGEAKAKHLAARLLEAYPVPLAPTRAPDLARGAALFAENCASCHGSHFQIVKRSQSNSVCPQIQISLRSPIATLPSPSMPGRTRSDALRRCASTRKKLRPSWVVDTGVICVSVKSIS